MGQPMADMAMAVTAMARGLLMLRPSLRLMPGTDMVASTATDSQPMADMAMAVTAMARGLLMLRPSLRLMPGTDGGLYGYGGYGYGKRSADAEAKPEADAWYGWWPLRLR